MEFLVSTWIVTLRTLPTPEAAIPSPPYFLLALGFLALIFFSSAFSASILTSIAAKTKAFSSLLKFNISLGFQ